MKKSFAAVLTVVLALGFLVGCASPTAAPTSAPVVTEAPVITEAPTAAPTEAPTVEPIIVTDALGRSVTFDTLPTRIVIGGKAGFMLTDAAFLFPEATERLIALVSGSQTSNDFVKMMYPQKTDLTFLDTKAAAEQIAPLNPEAVILKSYLKESVGDPIEALGIKVIYLDLETPEAINKDILTLGELFGNKERADQLVANYDMAAKKVTDVTASLTESDKPSVLMLQYSDKGDEIAFKVPPMDWLQTSLVTMAGGTPVWKDVPTDGWTTITLEQVAAWNPQVILLVDYKGRAADLVAGLKEDANWKLLDAVKNGKLYAFPLDFQSWDQPDTRWTLGLTWLAQKLHPELFPTVNMTDEVTKFYEDFYGFDQDTISSTILPLLKGDL